MSSELRPQHVELARHLPATQVLMLLESYRTESSTWPCPWTRKSYPTHITSGSCDVHALRLTNSLQAVFVCLLRREHSAAPDTGFSSKLYPAVGRFRTPILAASELSSLEKLRNHDSSHTVSGTARHGAEANMLVLDGTAARGLEFQPNETNEQYRIAAISAEELRLGPRY